ncbi:MAG: hypothetical protein CMD92_04710 [Gammaproteobacteria bacterium]|nr:hypothetical protein [Gammaproteobacteria bacterium]
MAEGNVYIEGIDPSIPGWATETTMSQIRQILAGLAADQGATNKALDQMKNSEGGDAQKAYKVLHDTLGEVRQQGAKEQKANQEEKNDRTRLAGQNTKIAGYFEQLIKQSEISNEIARSSAERDREQFIKKTTGQNPNITEEMAGMEFDKEKLKKNFEDVSAAVGKSAIGILASTGMINSFMGQQTEDRFNMAQEIRQSGLMAGFDSVTASLSEMSGMINENNFTLGEAAEFTKRFSRSVGMVGVEASLKFANSLTKSQDAGGLDLMGRFGLEFGEVTSMAGEYLDSLRNMGMLDRMSQQQLRDGMDDFMSGVSSTANVLKINMEDAAKMISQTLQRDDVTSRLVTMDPNRAANIRETIGSAGMLEGTLGQALIERMASGSQGAFVREQTFQQLSGTGLGKELLPIIERLALAGEQGPEAFQAAIANLSPDIQGIIASASTEGNRAVLQQDQFLQSIIADLSRMQGTISDADAGPVAPSQEDKAVLQGIENRRQAIVGLEDIFNTQVKGFTDILGEMNAANAESIKEFRRLGNELGPVATIITDLSGTFEVIKTDFFTSLAGMAADISAWSTKNLGIRDENQDQKNLENEITAGETTENLTEGKGKLDDENSGVIFDNNNENIFDQILKGLEATGPNKDEQIANATEKMVELMGMFDNGDSVEDRNAQMLEFAKVLEVLSKTDAAQTDAGKKNLEAIYEALTNMDTNMASFFKPKSVDDRNTAENQAEQTAILAELQKLINALNNN